MGTCNFHTVNARNVFVLLDYFDEDGERYENEWSFLKEDILCVGLDKGWDDSKSKSFRFGRDYDISVICKEYWFEYRNSGIKYRITAYITMNAGYYEHGNLDYRLVVDYEDSDTPVEEIVDRLVDDFTEDYYSQNISYISGGIITNKIWNIGLRKMQASNFRKSTEEFIDGIVNDCENLCRDLSHTIIRKVGTFSNGEGVYEKVD